MWDIDSRAADSSHGFGLGKTWTGASKHILDDDQTLPKQRPLTWAGPGTGCHSHSRSGIADDGVPARKAPAPSHFQATDLIQRIEPDPLLTVTPEKSIGLSRMGKGGSGDTTSSKGRGKDVGRATYVRDSRHESVEQPVKKGKQRVRFAPDTRTSPPSAQQSVEDGLRTSSVDSSTDDDSVPRNFAAVSEKLYQPGRYADSDSDAEPFDMLKTTDFSRKTHPSRYILEAQGENTVYVPVSGDSSEEQSRKSKEKPVTAKVVRHQPNPRTKTENREVSAADTEVKDLFENRDSLWKSGSKSNTSNRSRSTSPYETHKLKDTGRCDSSSPTVHRKSPSGHSSCKSPTRLPNNDPPGPPFLVAKSGPKPRATVTIVREAPIRPAIRDYLFPFDQDRQTDKQESSFFSSVSSEVETEEKKYDSVSENPLARPEFNSTLKISEDLKSVKERKPDTWGTVTKTLQTSERKRTEIQEKASSRVNVEVNSDLFSGLVEIDVPLDDIRQNLEREKTLQAPPPKPAPVKVPVGKEPDIMEFFPTDLQRELPNLSLSGIQPITESLSTANPFLAFDLYRHNRAWSGVADS